MCRREIADIVVGNYGDYIHGEIFIGKVRQEPFCRNQRTKYSQLVSLYFSHQYLLYCYQIVFRNIR